MRRTQISFSGAVDLNTFDLPAAVRRNERNHFALEKEAYSLGGLPQRKLSPVFDETNRPPPRPPEKDDPDLLPITEQPKSIRRVRREMTSPSQDDGSESGREPSLSKRLTTLLRIKPAMRTVKDEKIEKDGQKSFSVDTALVVAVEEKLKTVAAAKPKKVKPVSVSWPAQDDYCAQSCLLWCCCCVGGTSWPPKRPCCRDQTLFEFCCPCCRVRICCPCCVECCERYSCKTCCAGMGKFIRNECCAICCDITDDEEEEDGKKDDKKSTKDEKDKKDGKDKIDEKDKKDAKKKEEEKKK